MINIISFVHENSWLIKICLSILMGVLISTFEYFLYKKYLPLAHRKNQRWSKIFITSLHGPFLWYIWLMVASFIIQIISTTVGFDDNFLEFLRPARELFTLLFLFWFAMRFITNWEKSLVHAVESGNQKAFRDSTSVNALAQLFRIASIIIILLMAMSAANLNISSLLAAGGIGGLALSFAAKDTLANFIGGLMVYWDRPFSVGDWVRSPDRNIEGTVINIGWRLTTIRTFDKRPLYVPNSVFSTVSVENPSRMLNRRIKTTIGVRYEDAPKVSAIVSDISNMLFSHPEINSNLTCFVRLVEFDSSSLNILIYTFTKTSEWVKFQAVQEDIFLKVIDIVTKHGAEFAYPASTLYLPKGVKSYNHVNEENDDSRNFRSSTTNPVN